MTRMEETRADSAVLAPQPLKAVAATRPVPALWRDYLELTKPEISFLVVISALAGFLLGSPGALDAWRLVWTLVGIALTAGGVGALNHYLEYQLDKGMRRTAERPLPAGRIAPARARTFGNVLVIAGIGLLCPTTNPLTAVLAGLTVVLYLYVYTPLKRKTTYNTLVGTLPGALPALGGYAAATGTLGAGGWALFLILAVWQMPHFLALAWMYRKDYARADFAMLPVVEPDGTSTARQTLLFTGLLLPVGALPFFVAGMGWLYLGGALLLGLWFLRPALAFYRTRSNQDARRVLKASILYIPLLLALILVERLI